MYDIDACLVLGEMILVPDDVVAVESDLGSLYCCGSGSRGHGWGSLFAG